MVYAVNPPVMGWDPTLIYDPGLTQDQTQTPPQVYETGMTVEDDAGTTWQYCRYTSAITIYAAVAIQAPTFTVATLTRTIGLRGSRKVAAPQIALSAPTSGSVGAWAWFATRGPMSIRALTGTQPNVRLYTNTTAGKLTASLTSNPAVEGAVLTATAAASVGSVIAATEMFTRGVAGNT